MAESIKVGAHGCVISPEVKDAGLKAGDEYGRTFPWLLPCEADETVIVDFVVFATDAQT